MKRRKEKPQELKFQYETLARQLLENFDAYEWSVQGFGMLRFYVTQEVRIHVWNSRLRVEGVSDVHTHPWHFHSTVLCGRVKQYRFTEATQGGKAFDKYTLRCGEDGKLESESERVLLARDTLEVVEPGQQYVQRGEEIHASYPEDGTITLIHRELVDARYPDHAFIYLPAGEEWVDAIPRPATHEEATDICTDALRRLNEDA